MVPIEKHINRDRLLNAMQLMKLRVEKQSQGVNSLENFVQIIDYATLTTPNTQIIYGRNGTGKTHLLRASCQYSEDHYEENKILPVYIDFRDLEFGPVMSSIPLEELISRFYRLFIYKIIDSLKEFSERVITIGILQNFFGGESKQKKQQIKESIQKLEVLLNQGKIEELFKEYVRKIDVETENSSKVEGTTGISSQISLSKADVKIGAGTAVSAEEIEKEKEKIELIYKGLAVIDYEAVRIELENITQLCGAKALILLIDEWSSVSLSIQPLLAEMIRKTLAVSNRIFLKFVALKYFTRTSSILDPPQRIGFQVGIDISQLTDLDNLLCYDIDNQGVKDFLTTVAFKHTRDEYPELSRHSVKQFENYLCTKIFESTSVYLELIRSSEGNPRDFLSLLSECITAAKASRDQKISHRQVIRAASNYFTQSKAPEIKNNPSVDALFKKIFSKSVQSKSKLFLISADKAESDNRVRELWHFRFIHLINPSYVVIDKETNVPSEYAIYSIDYGKLMSLKVDSVGEKFVDSLSQFGSTLVSALLPWNPFALSQLMKSEVLGGKLKRMAGRVLVDGVEISDLNNTENLISNCVVDSLLL